MSNVPLPEPELFYWKPSFVKGESIQIKGYTAEAMHAHAAAVSSAKDAKIERLRERVRVLEDALPEPDCRTCKRAAIQHGVTRCTSPYFCTNADHYEPLPPVRLWRTT